jgi:mono/diheme cytochrome c family protein
MRVNYNTRAMAKTQRISQTLFVAAAVFIASAGSVLVTAQAKTVWDGVYTEAQAARATAVFGSSCSNCHTLDASGNRPLSGQGFMDSYTQKTVGDLLAYVSKNMPNGANAGTLPAATYNDLVALILKSNGFPAGAAEVTPEAVAKVQIIGKDGSVELPAGTLVRVVGCLTKGGSDWVLGSATAPERVDKAGVGADDATKPLGSGTTALKFVLQRLDKFAGQRMSVSGLLLGPGGRDGINVTTVSPVAPTCP